MAEMKRARETRYGVALALVMAVGGVPVAPASGSHCEENWICVDEIRHGDVVELFARNLRDFPVTYTLSVRSRSYAFEGGSKITDTLAPYERRRAVVLRERPQSQRFAYRMNVDWTVGDKNANHDDDQLYALPYAKGKSFRVLQGYNSRFSHRGREEYAVDFDMPEGTPVHAARAGVVARVVETNDRGCWEDGCGRYANYIVVLHSDGTTGEYYHLRQNGALVREGDSVARGQLIGRSGNTGHTSMPHLHFAVYRATIDGQTQSIPVRFQSADGIVTAPRRGAYYLAVF
jgi:murein DD-endopeptidase MepM/ murein hydrolase activator NlpD